MFDVQHIVEAGGLLVVGLMVFAESGLLIGILLPGDSLLLAAGLFAGHGHLNIYWLIGVVIVSAIAGYEVGYYLGERIGPRLFKRKDGFLFREEYLGRTQKFFNKYGPVTVVGARFVAHVRTLVSVIAGASSMDRRRYFAYNVIGAVLWGTSLPLMTYWLGSRVPNIDKYLVIAVVGTLLILYGFTLWQLAKTPQRRKKLFEGLRADWQYFFGSKKN